MSETTKESKPHWILLDYKKEDYITFRWLGDLQAHIELNMSQYTLDEYEIGYVIPEPDLN